MHMLAVFLTFHDIDYRPTNQEVVKIGLSIDDGTIVYDELFNWLKKIIKQ